MDYFDFILELEDWCHNERLRERTVQRQGKYVKDITTTDLITLIEHRKTSLKKLKLFIKDEIEELNL